MPNQKQYVIIIVAKSRFYSITQYDNYGRVLDRFLDIILSNQQCVIIIVNSSRLYSNSIGRVLDRFLCFILTKTIIDPSSS
jgi:hypothetical protein